MNPTEPVELFAIPFSCSLATHLALREAGLPHVVRWVSRGGGLLEDGSAFAAINPKGKVATLRWPGGEVLTENIAVLLRVAAEAPVGQLAPASGSPGWLRTVEWLSFVATELHKQVLHPSFDFASPEATKRDVLERLLPPVLAHAERRLSSVPWLLGETAGPSVADAYLFWGLLLVKKLGVAFEPYPALSEFRRRMLARPHVEAVLALERDALARAGGAR